MTRKTSIAFANMKLALTVGILALMLASCATPNVEQSARTDGDEGYTLNCTGIRYIWNDCYDQAERLCPEGYRVLEELAETSMGGMFWRGLASDTVQELVIECMG